MNTPYSNNGDSVETTLNAYRVIIQALQDDDLSKVESGVQALSLEAVDPEWLPDMKTLSFMIDDCADGLADISKEDVINHFNDLVFRYSQKNSAQPGSVGAVQQNENRT